MNYSNLTLSERETLAYMSGDSTTAALLAQLDDNQTRSEKIEESLLDSGIDIDAMLEVTSLDVQIDDIVKDRCPDYAAYKAFFEECFARLDGRYPCPSVTNEYDNAVIFEAIEKGERVQELEEEIAILKEELRLAGLELRRYGL